MFNYHTHTHFCGHATGTPEEYVKRAIECGVKYMGFSDHMPLKFSDGFEAGFRVKVTDAEKYCSEISYLKEKYSDRIDIKIGFEMEYYEDMFGEMLKNAVSYGAEYLILGQHYYEPENINGAKHSNEISDDAERLKKYVKSVIKAIKTGVFSYVAHPDMFQFVGDVSVFKSEMRKICIASKECNIPLEMNFLGIRDNRCYPNLNFWEMAGEEQSPMTFGFDAHDVMSAYDDKSLEKAKLLIKKYNLNYIGMPEILNIRK